jgi:hypothetical protein
VTPPVLHPVAASFRGYLLDDTLFFRKKNRSKRRKTPLLKKHVKKEKQKQLMENKV